MVVFLEEAGEVLSVDQTIVVQAGQAAA